MVNVVITYDPNPLARSYNVQYPESGIRTVTLWVTIRPEQSWDKEEPKVFNAIKALTGAEDNEIEFVINNTIRRVV